MKSLSEFGLCKCMIQLPFSGGWVRILETLKRTCLVFSCLPLFSHGKHCLLIIFMFKINPRKQQTTVYSITREKRKRRCGRWQVVNSAQDGGSRGGGSCGFVYNVRVGRKLSNPTSAKKHTKGKRIFLVSICWLVICHGYTGIATKRWYRDGGRHWYSINNSIASGLPARNLFT